ncbi:hypothetical protein [Nocardioides sp.]|jgi:hypothetical protein|uniref:hypothetical protein n=1 Tax=Nocardioides sp. TaxID=35761 RepID=UPI002F403CE6
MSTIHHRPIHLNLWWYAAAAVLAGAVFALILATLQLTGTGSDGPGPSTNIDTGRKGYHGNVGPNPYVCRAGHPIPNVELPGCVSPAR